MKKIAAHTLMILAILHLVFTIFCLFRVDTGNLHPQTYIKMAAFTMLISCFYGYLAVGMYNRLTDEA